MLVEKRRPFPVRRSVNASPLGIIVHCVGETLSSVRTGIIATLVSVVRPMPHMAHRTEQTLCEFTLNTKV